MIVTITGASGFVGQNLSQYLHDKNYTVKTLSLRENGWENTIDVNSHSIVHMAGKAHDTKNTTAAGEYFQVNTELTKKLFNIFLQSDVRDFIYFSSVKAVADTVDGILTEDAKPNPQTPYGQSKYNAEEYLLSKQLPEGKRLFIIRPCMIHGPGNKGNLNLLYQFVSKGLPWPLGAFENQRSFLSIENLCFVIKELLENELITSGVYQIADDKALSTNQLIQLLRDSLDKKGSIWSIPVSWIRGVAKLGDSLSFPLNSERLHKLTENYVVSNEKIVKAIDKSLPVSSEEGLMRTFESFRK